MFEAHFNAERGCGDPRRAMLHRMAYLARCYGRRRGMRAEQAGHGCRGHDSPETSDPRGWDAGGDLEFDWFEEGGEGMGGGEREGRRGHRPGWGGVFGFQFGGPRGRGPGMQNRPLEQGDLRWLTLDLIAAQPRHGYEIIKEISDALSGHYTPSPGVIYPTLTLLEETGLIASEARGPKKLYSLTEEGRAELAAHAAEVQAVRDRLKEANARFGGHPAPELHRAMQNLRAALQVRLAKGPLSAEALLAVTAALDRAASEIERS